MKIVVKTIPSLWLSPLLTGDDSTLDNDGRLALARFRGGLVRRHGDWRLSRACGEGWTLDHAGYRYGVGACWCCLAVFIAWPPPRTKGPPPAVLVAAAARWR